MNRELLEGIIAAKHPSVSDIADSAEAILARYANGTDEHHALARGLSYGYLALSYLHDAGVFTPVEHTGEQGIPLRYTRFDQ